MTQKDQKALEFMSNPSTTQVVLYILGHIAEELAGRPIPDLHRWRLVEQHMRAKQEDLVSAFIPVVKKVIDVVSLQLENSKQGYELPRSEDKVKKVAMTVKSLMVLTDITFADLFSNYTSVR